MSQKTSIGWTDVTWNFAHGCSIVSTECRNCYAMELSLRYGQTTRPWTPANAAENVLLKPHKLREPLSRAKPYDRPVMVFVNSMSDAFHEMIPDAFLAEAFSVMARAPQHTFQILTKRPERMRELMRDPEFWNAVEHLAGAPVTQPLPNVWLGVSVGLRNFVGRADLLRDTPAAVRFISAEPLLGPLIAHSAHYLEGDQAWTKWNDGHAGPELNLTGVDWLIAGGESGPRARPMREEWVRDLKLACDAAGTAFFYKQSGSVLARQRGAPGKGEDPAFMPEDLRVRDFPAGLPGLAVPGGPELAPRLF